MAVAVVLKVLLEISPSGKKYMNEEWYEVLIMKIGVADCLAVKQELDSG
jgi:hypothetical protein